MHSIRLILVLLIIFVFAQAAMALPTIQIADITSDPAGYRDLRVKLVGQVTKIQVDPVAGTGVIYSLQDSSDQVIRVKSRVAPRLESRIYVVGAVTQDDDVSKPYIIEIKHGTPGPPLQLLLGLAGILLTGTLVLAYYVVVPKPTKKRIEPVDSPVLERRPIVTQVFRDDPVAVLTALAGPHKGEIFKIFSGINTIGRNDNQTVQLGQDTTISRSQATIEADENRVMIKNNSEINPTRVSGEEVEEKELNDGDIIQIGSTKLKVTIIQSS